MTVLTEAEFKEFIKEFPELEQCYDMSYSDTDLMDAPDQDTFEAMFSQYFN